MKTIRFFSILLFLGVVPAQAQTHAHAQTQIQVKSTMDSLRAYTWRLFDINDIDETYFLYESFFEKGVVTESIWADEPGEKNILCHNYYLSTTKDVSSFDETELGKVKNGRFIVTKLGGKLFVDYIVELTDKKLILYSMQTHVCTEWKALPKINYSFEDASEPKRIDYSVAKAQDFFYKYVSESPFFNYEHTRSHEADPLFGIDITPDWLNSVLSQENELISVDVPILETRNITVTRVKVQEEITIVNAVQKLIIIKELGTLKEGAYLMTLIPEKSFCPRTKTLDVNSFINTGDKNEYSGWVVYSLAMTSAIMRLDYYEDGVKQYGYHMFGDKEENLAANEQILGILSEMIFTISQ